MKILLVVFIALFSMPLLAQQEKSGKDKMDKTQRAEKMQQRKDKAKAERNEKLGLSETQVKQMDEINAKYREVFQSQKEANRETNRAQAKEIHQEREAELKKILSEEQFAQWKEMRSERKGKNMKKFEHRTGKTKSMDRHRNGKSKSDGGQ